MATLYTGLSNWKKIELLENLIADLYLLLEYREYNWKLLHKFSVELIQKATHMVQIYIYKASGKHYFLQ